MAEDRPQLVVSNSKGKIYTLSHLEGAGMKGGSFFRLSSRDLIKLPSGSELFMLPQRAPVGYDPKKCNFTVLDNLFAVAAFISPGYTACFSSPYIEKRKPQMLPLFSYCAVVFHRGEFHVAAVRIDSERRQDLRLMNIKLAGENVRKMRKLFPDNRLIRHLEGCALTYGCPAAKNFFLKRYEAPLPTSPYCNAMCIGCISYQPREGCSVSQPRIEFVPTPEEVAQTAVYHINNVKDPVVSFGQGCEGEPLLVDDVLEKAIKLIRNKTSKGMINLNTNASRPEAIARLFDAGLDSIRVSMNSVRNEYYTRYYKPKKYKYRDVLRSISIAARKKGFISINYLVMPGFTDYSKEVAALERFASKYKISMIQWRNLNYDPRRYFKALRFTPDRSRLIGVKQAIGLIKKGFPHIMAGYFNPSRQRIKRNIG